MNFPLRRGLCLTPLAAAAVATTVFAQVTAAPFAPAPPPAASDDAARGPWYPTFALRPAEAEAPVRLCSFVQPVCVHAPRGLAPGDLLGTLAELEQASARFVDAMRLPAPLGDGGLGGGPELDLYLVDEVAQGGEAPRSGWAAERDPPLPGAIGASAFLLLERRRAAGCTRGHLIASAFASAAGWGIDAAEQPAGRAARAAYAADIVAPCAGVALDALDEFQAHPERAIVAADPKLRAEAPGSFPSYLDDALSASPPAVLPFALAALAGAGAARAEPVASHLYWQDEPDLFDALRANLKSRVPPSSMGDLLLEFAIARAFTGDRDDGVHLAPSGWSGSFGRVRFEWSVPASTLPRRLAPRAPIDPTGATYLWVDLREAPKSAALAFRAEWEPPVLFRWAVVRVGPDGRELSRVTVTPQDRSTSAERRIEDLAGLAGLVIVGTNVGDIGLDHPFDPDERPFEPHGYVVTLAPL